MNPTSLVNGVIGTSYSQTITATGGTALHTFTVSVGSLPAGLVLNSSTGVNSGTPTSATATTFTVRATDVYGCTGTRVYTVTPVCPVITLNPVSLAEGLVGAAYSQTLSATGGTPAYQFALTAGTMPAGLNLNTSTGVISGTPTAGNGAGVSLTFRATDAYGCFATRPVTLKICPIITLNPLTLPGGNIGAASRQTISASGWRGSLHFCRLSGFSACGPDSK